MQKPVPGRASSLLSKVKLVITPADVVKPSLATLGDISTFHATDAKDYQCLIVRLKGNQVSDHQSKEIDLKKRLDTHQDV